MSKCKLKYKNFFIIIFIVIYLLWVGFGFIDWNILNKLD